MKTPAINDSAIFLLSRLLILSQAFFYFDLFWFFSIPKSFPPPREHGSGYSFSRSLKQMRSSSEKKKKKKKSSSSIKKSIIAILSQLQMQKSVKYYKTAKNHQCIRLKKNPKTTTKKNPQTNIVQLFPGLRSGLSLLIPPFFFTKKKKNCTIFTILNPIKM